MYSDLPNLQDNPNFDKVLASLLSLPLLTRDKAVNLVVMSCSKSWRTVSGVVEDHLMCVCKDVVLS